MKGKSSKFVFDASRLPTGSTYVYDKRSIFIYYDSARKRADIVEGFNEQKPVYCCFVDGCHFITVSRVKELDGTPTKQIIWQINKESLIF
jgi:hypothetical protein